MTPTTSPGSPLELTLPHGYNADTFSKQRHFDKVPIHPTPLNRKSIEAGGKRYSKAETPGTRHRPVLLNTSQLTRQSTC
jgi:hypothetical protein